MSAQVLITGATGHVGSGVLLEALRQGYSVRAAVRSLSSKDKILHSPAIKKNNFGEKLTFVEVPDILAAGAYAEAVKDVEYVIHMASPITHPRFANTNLQETVVDPAIRGTTNVLEASLASPKIKRVVITSSVVANSDISRDVPTNAHTREPIPEFHDLRTAYRASKHAALLASDKFMEEKKPHFDLINVMPSYVVGRKEFATSPDDLLAGSNGIAFALVTQGPQPFSSPGATVHLDDVACVHVDALKLPGKENRSFGVTTNFNPNEVYGILRRHFPEAIENGTFKQPAGLQQYHPLNWDASETEKVFGIKFKSLDKQIISVVQQLLELKAAI